MNNELRIDLQRKLEAALLALEAALTDGRPDAFLPVKANLRSALALLHEESETDSGALILTDFRLCFGEYSNSDYHVGGGRTYDPTRVGLAMALDDCQDAITEGLALFGRRRFGGVWVEASYYEDMISEDEIVERVTGLWDIADLEFGDIFEARRFRDKQREGTVKVGGNLLPGCTSHIDELLPRKRGIRRQNGKGGRP